MEPKDIAKKRLKSLAVFLAAPSEILEGTDTADLLNWLVYSTCSFDGNFSVNL